MLKVWTPVSRYRPWIGQVPALVIAVAAPLISTLSISVVSANQDNTRNNGIVYQTRVPRPLPAVLVTSKLPNSILVVKSSNKAIGGQVYKINIIRPIPVAPVTSVKPRPIRVVSIYPTRPTGKVWINKPPRTHVAVIYPACSWGAHFTDNGWTTIQDQIDAGYPLYLQPAPLVGTYEKIFDFGAVFDNIIINLSWNSNQIAGSTTIGTTIATSTDDVTYTTPVSGRSLFSASARYVKVKVTFTGATPHALLEFYNLVVGLNVKSEVDSGQVNADKDDVGGTIVLFNKTFKDVNSITITADSIEPIYPIYDFVDIPNPTQFKVLIYDSSGQRVDYLVSWKARGIT